jgi:hypothetical protein
MLKNFLFWIFSVKASLCGCGGTAKARGFQQSRAQYHVVKLGLLPRAVRESSGLAQGHDTSLWTHSDDGQATLYRVGPSGSLLDSLHWPGLTNHDWEDLAQDTQGRLYIGDFGNNTNTRRNLAIYRWQPRQTLDTIQFRYADQVAFPPPKQARNFDCEAFFAWGDSLYLFSKNRGKPWLKMYVIPQQPGQYVAAPRDSIYLKGMVTAADASADGQQFTLLMYGRMLTFGISPGQPPRFDQPRQCIRLARSQAEGLVYAQRGWVVSNEQRQLFGVVPRK